MLDVQETDFSFSKFNGSWNHLSIRRPSDGQNQPSKTKDSSVQGNLWHRVMSSPRKKNQTKVPTTHDNSELFHIDSVPSNVNFSRSIAMLHVFEDNEAVIKMIHFHRKYKQFFFVLGRVNFLMQLQFLAPVELFFKQLKGYSF